VSPQAEKFLAGLRARAGKGVRVSAADYRDAFADVCPTLGGEEFRARLAALCAELASGDYVSLPRSESLYDHAGVAKLPAWIDVSRAVPVAEPLPVDPASFPWAPELRFACDIREVRQLDTLLRIQSFLSNGGRTRPMVPAKERSVELFGEEKRLERLRNNSLFGHGKLSLELLRCFVVLPPLVFEALPPAPRPRSILILENYSTYHSFARWNRESQIYEAIFYGHGDSFETAAAGLVEVTRSMSWDRRAFYFGDLDVKGVLIPVAASETLKAANFPALAPHIGCYRHLLERAVEVELLKGTCTTLTEQCHEWLGKDLSREADIWLARGKRLPQELVGWEELRCAGQVFAHPESSNRR
jgi:hypothetical protein